jgi:hypothetical protein
MNWDAIGAIAELLGAIGVIASLVYLATQIRHSREQMRAATYQQLHDHIGESATSLPESDMELTRQGNQDLQRLSEEDAYRYNLWAMRMMTSLENAHYQYRIGMLDEDRWRLHRFTLQGFLGMPGFAQWWKEDPLLANGLLSPEFAALVEEILGEEAAGVDPTE